MRATNGVATRCGNPPSDRRLREFVHLDVVVGATGSHGIIEEGDSISVSSTLPPEENTDWSDALGWINHFYLAPNLTETDWKQCLRAAGYGVRAPIAMYGASASPRWTATKFCI